MNSRHHPLRSLILALLAVLALGNALTAQVPGSAGTPVATVPATATPVPTPAPDAPKDALGQPFCNLYPAKVRPQEYDRWVTFVLSREPEEQAWLRNAEKVMGEFYGSGFIKSCIAAKDYDPTADCFGYIKDDPKLPRVLIIGNSISRGYTVPTRMALKGLANLHRAPANCGRTDYFFKDSESWLLQNGSDKWDIITVGYGIHDAGKSPQAYTDNLKAIITRLRQTGATIILVNATPWYDKEDTARAKDLSPGVNATLETFAKQEGLTVINHHDLVLPRITELQAKDGTHFNEEGYRFLGESLAEQLKPLCKPKP